MGKQYLEGPTYLHLGHDESDGSGSKGTSERYEAAGERIGYPST